MRAQHNDVDPEFDMQMGDYFEGFIQEEAQQMGKTLTRSGCGSRRRRARLGRRQQGRYVFCHICKGSVRYGNAIELVSCVVSTLL